MEAGITAGWEKYIGHGGISIGIDHYGASAPGRDLAHEFGFTADQVSKKIQDHLDPYFENSLSNRSCRVGYEE